MRVLLQRVNRAQVTVDDQVIGKIRRGFVLLLGVHHGDGDEQINFLVEKILNLRVFEDQDGKFNLSLKDVQGEVLIVSQFTLYADCSKGRRPSFVDAASPDKAESLYNKFVQNFRETGLHVETGHFQAHMLVELVNDGPVTIMLEK